MQDAHLSFWTTVVLPLLVWLFAIVKRTSTWTKLGIGWWEEKPTDITTAKMDVY